MPLYYYIELLLLADVDTLKCAAVRTLRRRTKGPLRHCYNQVKDGPCRERGDDDAAAIVCTMMVLLLLLYVKSPAAATWGVSPKESIIRIPRALP